MLIITLLINLLFIPLFFVRREIQRSRQWHARKERFMAIGSEFDDDETTAPPPRLYVPRRPTAPRRPRQRPDHTNPYQPPRLRSPAEPR